MTTPPLLADILARIDRDGPMRLDLYMALCLGHPEHGYYRTRDPLGVAGDFTTAPEVSQIFGELVGLWAAQTWFDQGAPTPVRLIELGPGRGALMADALRAIDRAAPAFAAALEVALVETSEPLRAAQAAALPGRAPRWFDATADALAGPAAPFVIANEFIDALPIRQFHRAAGVWRERAVTRDADRLALTLIDADPAAARADRLPDPPDGAVLETNPAGEAVAAAIGAALRSAGAGAALIVDYGYDHGMLRAAGGRDTFQALRAHRFVDPLAEPGRADLTAHVDFDALAAAAGGPAFGPIGQGSFLRALGAEARAAALARANPARAEAIAAGLHRLTQPTEMGRLFKALALTPPGRPAPPGFPADRGPA